MHVPTEADLIRQMERQGEIMMTLPADLPDVTRFVIATDMEHAERLLVQFEAGRIMAEDVVRLSGSFSRCEMAVTLVEQGLLSDEWLLPQWPELWRGADPDDTDPRFLDVWKRAVAANGGKYLRDGDRLPRQKGNAYQQGYLTIYRGGVTTTAAREGIAWSHDRSVAEKFAAGMGTRAMVNGVLVKGMIRRDKVLGYLTGRNEYEVVVNPTDVFDIRPC